MELKKIIICSKCKGEGKIKVPNMREWHDHDEKTCPDCGGNGKVKRIVTIKYEML